MICPLGQELIFGIIIVHCALLQKGRINMCVGLSAKVVNVKDGTALIDAGGAQREVSAGVLDDLEPGDYVMVHAGVAIAKITETDEQEAADVMGDIL